MEIKTIDKEIALIKDTGIIIKDSQDALDLIMSVKYETGCKKIVMRKECVEEDFFVLSTQKAGEILEKFIIYKVKLALFGDYSKYTSKPLLDFIRESNKGHDIFFTPDEESAIKALKKAL